MSKSNALAKYTWNGGDIEVHHRTEDWDESKHPRVAAGSAEGGEFTSGAHGGDFSRVSETKDRGAITRLLKDYKKVHHANYHRALDALASAYLKGGTVKLDAAQGGDIEAEKSDLARQEIVDQFVGLVEDTQKALKKAYPSGKVTLYRGVKGSYADAVNRALDKDGEVAVATRSIDSWTDDLRIAQDFAAGSSNGIVIKHEVPIGEIMFSYKGPPGTGIAHDEDDETWDEELNEEHEHLWGNPSNSLRITKANLAPVGAPKRKGKK